MKPAKMQLKFLFFTVYLLIALAHHYCRGGPTITTAIFGSEEEEAEALARYTSNLSTALAQQKGSFIVAFSGAPLIQSLRKLTEPPYVDSVDWSKWLIFWADERVVPLDDPDSNYKLAKDGFLSKVAIPAGNIFAINDHHKSPEGTALDYEFRLKELVIRRTIPLSKASGFPKFDLILLGMGPDGHVASLFPSRPQRFEKKRWVTFIKDSPKPPPQRISFTFPVINSASEVAMVITGNQAADAVKTVFSGYQSPGGAAPVLPASQVSPEGGLTWFLDRDAASKLHD